MHTKEYTSKIPIHDNILNKYSTVKEIFDSKNKYNIKVIKLYNIPKLKNDDLKYLKIENFKKLCNYTFNQFHNVNYFYNNDNKIFVSKASINESAQKIFNNREQRE